MSEWKPPEPSLNRDDGHNHKWVAYSAPHRTDWHCELCALGMESWKQEDIAYRAMVRALRDHAKDRGHGE